jgi:LysW-gamma-L-lysine carboxypeptidase
MTEPISRARAEALLHGLVAIPSLSRDEARAAAWLVTQMEALGFARSYIDGAGNAVGEIGAPDAPVTLLLLGHIDTVPGAVPVRVEQTEAGPVLFGRGSVDAKGPLAAFVAGAALAGHGWALEAGVRVVVVGAVEEEAATSLGARSIRDRFNGVNEPLPTACIIGEPSGWSRVTLGYKGRLLVEMEAWQPMAHTAGPDAGVAVAAVSLWNHVAAWAVQANQGRDKAFDQVQPSLRSLRTWSDEGFSDWVEAQVGIRLPLDFDGRAFVHALAEWAAEESGAPLPAALPIPAPEAPAVFELAGERRGIRLRLHAAEAAWRSDRNGSIVRALLASIRSHSPTSRPTYVLKTGTSDMNVVAPAWLCPIAAYGPGDSSLDHTPHERINLDEYWAATQIVAQCLRDFTSFL